MRNMEGEKNRLRILDKIFITYCENLKRKIKIIVLQKA